MRVLRNVLLLLAMALVAMFSIATAAWAQDTEVEVIDEETGLLCNPCTVHIEGESHIRAMPAGVIVFACHDEFFLDVYYNGFGEIAWAGTTHPGPGCLSVNCITGTERHWPLSGFGEEGDGMEHVTYRFCLRGGADVHCDGRLRISDGGYHRYTITTSPPSGIVCANGARIVEGQWETEDPHNPGEGDQEMEVVHHVN